MANALKKLYDTEFYIDNWVWLLLYQALGYSELHFRSEEFLKGAYPLSTSTMKLHQARWALVDWLRICVNNLGITYNKYGENKM